MKKRVLTLMMALVMILGLVGCGGGGKNPAGTYSLTKMSFGEEEMDVEGRHPGAEGRQELCVGFWCSAGWRNHERHLEVGWNVPGPDGRRGGAGV